MEKQTEQTPANPTITLVLSMDEGQRLMDCLDTTVKAGGLQNAKVALPLAEKLMAASQEAIAAAQKND